MLTDTGKDFSPVSIHSFLPRSATSNTADDASKSRTNGRADTGSDSRADSTANSSAQLFSGNTSNETCTCRCGSMSTVFLGSCIHLVCTINSFCSNSHGSISSGSCKSFAFLATSRSSAASCNRTCTTSGSSSINHDRIGIDHHITGRRKSPCTRKLAFRSRRHAFNGINSPVSILCNLIKRADKQTTGQYGTNAVKGKELVRQVPYSLTDRLDDSLRAQAFFAYSVRQMGNKIRCFLEETSKSACRIRSLHKLNRERFPCAP